MDKDKLHIGIIGTAGRKDDFSKLSKEKFIEMKEAVLRIISIYDQQAEIVLVSGGAAWADHIAVQLALEYPDYGLQLYLPAPVSQMGGNFMSLKKHQDPGSIANHYHTKFSFACGFYSLVEIYDALKLNRTTASVYGGFKTRNTKVAAISDIMVALTFGRGNTLKDGGTADTMCKFLSKNKGASYHIDLNTMMLHTPAVVV